MKIKLGKSKKKQRRKRSGSEVNTESISEKGKFAIVESYKAARTNIMFALSADDNKIFAVTSYSKGEGKSTVSANLAISFSKMEKRVLLVDCDLRRPNIHNIFKLENTVGVSNVIGKMAEYEETVHRDVLPNLDILTSGTIPPNPSELICSAKFVNLIKSLYDEYDYIIFDTPPIGVVSDALLLKDLIAGFVVVLRERSTTHGDIQNLLESIKLTDTKLLGFVKVGCTHTKHIGKKGYYYYQYYYYY
ncbi:MAG: CpsD/CapB family tyrosine-protein kinase [Ruminococcus sp.]|nr:CpsD/CapB family tyrosine-protein kinase [Ruminococcus sp.]